MSVCNPHEFWVSTILDVEISPKIPPAHYGGLGSALEAPRGDSRAPSVNPTRLIEQLRPDLPMPNRGRGRLLMSIVRCARATFSTTWRRQEKARAGRA